MSTPRCPPDDPECSPTSCATARASSIAGSATPLTHPRQPTSCRRGSRSRCRRRPSSDGRRARRPIFPTGEDALDLAEQFAFGPRTIQRARPRPRCSTQRADDRARRDAGPRSGVASPGRFRPRRPRSTDRASLRLGRHRPAGRPRDQLHEIAGQVGSAVPGLRAMGLRHQARARPRDHGRSSPDRAGPARRWPPRCSRNDLGLDLYRIDLAGRRQQVHRRDREEPPPRSSTPPSGPARSCSSTRPTRSSASGPRSATATIATRTSRSTTCSSGWRTTAGSRSSRRTCGACSTTRSCGASGSSSTSRSPTAPIRRAIWARVFPPEAAADIDADALSRLEVAGGSIRSIAVNAAFFAAEDGDAIGMDHVMRAARREYSKIDKLVVESEFHPQAWGCRMSRRHSPRRIRPRLRARRADATALPGRLEAALRRSLSSARRSASIESPRPVPACRVIRVRRRCDDQVRTPTPSQPPSSRRSVAPERGAQQMSEFAREHLHGDSSKETTAPPRDRRRSAPEPVMERRTDLSNGTHARVAAPTSIRQTAVPASGRATAGRRRTATAATTACSARSSAASSVAASGQASAG